MFNPTKLIIARKRRKLTRKELAGKAGISPVTITRNEKEYTEPDPETLTKIANALEFPKEFFFGDNCEELTTDSASFRSMAAMTAKERDGALSAGALAYIISDWVSERFNLPEVDLLNLGNETNPQNAAMLLRQHWGLGEKPINNMMRLLELKGVRIFSLAEQTMNVDAFSCWRNSIPYIFINTMKSAEHSRFDTAHELGHLILHQHGGPQGREAEVEANIFASSFLMPRKDVISQVSKFTSVDQVIRAKKRWRVSVAALGYRMHKIGLLTDWQYRFFCIQINKKGYRTREPNEIPREESDLWKMILTDLWKNDGITRQHIANELKIPANEVDNLICGLINSNKNDYSSSERKPFKPQLLPN